MIWLLLTLLTWLWTALAWPQALPFPGPGDRGRGGAGPFVDAFTRADGALGANWTNNMQSHTIVSNTVTGTAGQDSLSSYTAQNLGTDHFAEITFTNVTATGVNGGPCVRVSGTSAYCYYSMTGNRRDLYRINAGGFTQLATIIAGANVTVGDKYRLAVAGTGATVSLTMKINGALDTALVAGGVFADTNANRLTTGNFAGLSVFSNTWRVDDFTCNTGG